MIYQEANERKRVFAATNKTENNTDKSVYWQKNCNNTFY